MSIIKAIKKCEYDFEVRAEKFFVASSCTWIFFHLCRNAFDSCYVLFVRLQLFLLFQCHCFLDGSNLYCILNCGSNDLCHIKRKRTMIMHGKVVKDYR